MIAVHVPGSPDHKFVDGVGVSGPARKKMFWESLIASAEKRAKDALILVGDFNTGLKKDAEGAPFTMHQYMMNLINLGFVDVWRALHYDESEFTWFSQRKVLGVTQDFNGFRLDYVFVSYFLGTRILSAFHSHDERTAGISDHAALICDIDLTDIQSEIADNISLEEAERQYKWALTVVNDPHASEEYKSLAKPLVEAQQRIWDAVGARLDEIMDIDDDDEREKAWDQWELEDLNSGIDEP